MERQLLSGEPAAGENAPVLRGAVSDGGDQLHLLPDTNGKDCRRLEPGDARSVQADTEGSETHHPRCPTARLWRSGPSIPGDRRHTRTQIGSAPVSAATEPQKGSATAGCISRHISATSVRRVRVPPHVMAR